MKLVAAIMFALCTTACIDTSDTPTDREADTGESDVAVANSSQLESPDATKNCGHMVWCDWDGSPIWCGTTSCTDQQKLDDAVSDCHTVCGKSACGNEQIYSSCSSGCDGAC
jgi:hypothetical protein